MKKPGLVVRRGKHGIISPTTSRGYVAQLILVLLFTGAISSKVLEHWERIPVVAVVSFIASLSLYDALAWFLATDEQRQEFVSYVRLMKEDEDRQRATKARALSRRESVFLTLLISLVLALIVFGVIRAMFAPAAHG